MKMRSLETVKELLTPKGQTIGIFVGNFFNKYMGVSIIIPIVFCTLGMKQIVLLPGGNLYWIVDEPHGIWPVGASQYSTIADFKSVGAADNYVVFILVLLCSLIVSLGFMTNLYTKRRTAISKLQSTDIILLLLTPVFGSYGLFLDIAKPYPKPLWNFTVDRFGFFYFRQWFVFLGVACAVYIIVFAAVSLIDNLLFRRKP